MRIRLPITGTRALLFALVATACTDSSESSSVEGHSSAIASCAPLSAAGVAASGNDGANVAANVLDGNVSTRWSSFGIGQHITLDLGSVKALCSVQVAWHQGNARKNKLTISLSSDGSSFTQVFSGQSSGTTTALETYDIPDGNARFVRVTVNGNTLNQWASITELKAVGGDAAICAPTAVSGVTASGNDGSNVAANVLDGSLSTRWSSYGVGQHITLDLGSVKKGVCTLQIAWHNGNARKNNFTVSLSSDGSSFTQVFSGQSSGTTAALETYDIADTDARFVRVTVNGNTVNLWASITEIKVSSGAAPPPSGSSSTSSGAGGSSTSSGAGGGTSSGAGGSSGAGAWPGPDNTGVPPGTTLTPSGSMTISQAGAVIDGRDIAGKVTVNAPNVTIKNSRIRGNTMWLVENNSTGLLVEDCEIINKPVAGQPNCHNGIGNKNLTVRRTEITGCENSMNIDSPGNITFEDNYVHDLDTAGPSYVWGNSPHTDGIQIGAGAQNLIIRHNWIDPSPGGGITAAIIMYTGSGTQNSNTWIEDNYLDGSGASYGIYANRHQTSNVFINGNHMLKGYGYTACVKLGVTVTTFDGNQDASSGVPLGPDNGFDGGCSN